MPSNELYLAVLPLIHLRDGLTEQTLTLFPDRNLATEFALDEVETFILFFKNRTDLLSGGSVTGYEIYKEPTKDGRVVVRVVQNVK